MQRTKGFARYCFFCLVLYNKNFSCIIACVCTVVSRKRAHYGLSAHHPFLPQLLLRSKTERPPGASIAYRDFPLSPQYVVRLVYTHARCKLHCCTVVYTSTRCFAHGVTHCFEHLVVHNIDYSNVSPRTLHRPWALFARVRYINNYVWIIFLAQYVGSAWYIAA